MTKKRLVVLSGAGVSAESGIATFRDSDGLWEQHRIEDVATPEAWEKDADLVNQFYNMRRQRIQEVNPNIAHNLLADLEEDLDVHIITQNIDDLHERAGSKNVLHLHGEILKMRCEMDEKDIQHISDNITPQHISKRGYRMRPHIVWFGEAVPAIENAAKLTQTADLFLVIGTSLNVYPAAGLIHYVPVHAPIFIIDRKIPLISNGGKVISIEKNATEGMKDFVQILKAKHL